MSDLDDVVRALRAGELGIFATETLWSLSCDAFDPAAVQKVFAAKQRPEGVPLAVGFPSWAAARPFIETTPLAERLAAAHLPGPLSIVVRRTDDRLAHVAPGFETLSIRVPDHLDALAVLEQTGPVVMTSANPHGAADPLTRADVDALFPDIPKIGEAVAGTGTTVVDATGDVPVVLRQGELRVETAKSDG